jgi:3-oxoacyl-[acyl-carrier-protein] synthase-3
MAFREIENIRIEGIAACVPEHIEENKSLGLFSGEGDYDKFLSVTGIERRRKVKAGVCASDLCFVAAQKLIEDLNWSKDEIECLIFVSQTPDYKLPATACVLQSRLGLANDCMAFDISMGCSGWVYGLTTLASIMAGGSVKKGLLLVGDTVTLTKSPLDKTTYPLFGDAGTATAVSFDRAGFTIKSGLYTDGGNFNAIMIEDGGYRNPVTPESFEVHEFENGSVRNRLQSYLDGSSVFTFGISKAPQSVNRLLEHYSINKDDVDFYVFHQANMLMNEKIRNKLKLPAEKVPYILNDYGNTSSASIPLTMIVRLSERLESGFNRLVVCGFGVGLSWGALYMELDQIKCSKLLMI